MPTLKFLVVMVVVWLVSKKYSFVGQQTQGHRKVKAFMP